MPNQINFMAGGTRTNESYERNTSSLKFITTGIKTNNDPPRPQ